jgi:hypothetical protein
MADTDVDFDLLIKAGGPVRNFKAGDVIFREGDPAVELFVVKSETIEPITLTVSKTASGYAV